MAMMYLFLVLSALSTFGMVMTNPAFVNDLLGKLSLETENDSTVSAMTDGEYRFPYISYVIYK